MHFLVCICNEGPTVFDSALVGTFGDICKPIIVYSQPTNEACALTNGFFKTSTVHVVSRPLKGVSR